MARPNTTRRRILDAAIDLAAEHGVTSTTIDVIAERAAVSKGSVYYNFASKDEVFAEAFALMAAAVSTAMSTARAEIATLPADDHRSALELVVRPLLALLGQRPTAARLFVLELLRDDRSWAESAAAVRGELVAAFGAALRRDAPLLAERIEVESGAVALVGAVLVTSLDVKMFRSDATLEQSIEPLLHTLLAVLSPSEPGA